MAHNTVKAGLTPYRMKNGDVFNGGREQFYIADAYATPLGEGDVVVVTDGVVTAAANTTAGVSGVFVGCYYIDPVTKQPVQSGYYPGGITNGGQIEGQARMIAYVVTGEDVTFLAKGTSTLAASTAGELHAVTRGTPSAIMKRSGSTIAQAVSTLPGTDVQVQIRSFPYIAGTKPGDDPTIVEVTLVNPKLV